MALGKPTIELARFWPENQKPGSAQTANLFQVRMALLNINTCVLSLNFFAIITP